MKEDILKLRQQGKTYSEIQNILNCSKSTISYHCNNTQKEKSLLRTKKYRTSNIKTILRRKLYEFVVISRDHKKDKKFREIPSFTVEDLIVKFGNNPKCYLTGVDIDLSNPFEYSFDHIIPRMQGGDNSIENLGLCTKEANYCKSYLTPDQLYLFCEKVLKYKSLTN